MPTRLLRGARGRAGRRRRGDQEGVSQARPRAASRRQPPRSRGRGEVQAGRRGLRGALRSRAPAHLRRVRARGPALAAAGRRTPRFGSVEDILSGFFGARRLAVRRPVRGRPRAGPAAAPTSRVEVEVTLAEVLTGASARSPSRRSRSASTAAATAPSRGRRSTPARPAAAPARAAGAPHAPSASSCRPAPARPAAAPARSPSSPASAATAPAASSASAPGTSRSRPGSSPASGSGSAAPATPASPGGRPATSTSRSGSPTTSASSAAGQDLVTVVEVPATLAMLGGEVGGRRRSTASARSRSPPAPSRATRSGSRASACPRCATAGAAIQHVLVDVVVPQQAQPRAAARARRAPARVAGRRGRRVIRLAVRCRPELAERVLAELLELAPGGVEEEQGDGWVEYAIYGPPGELPGAARARGGGRRRAGRDQLDRDPRRLGGPLARLPRAGRDRRRAHRRPAVLGGRSLARPRRDGESGSTWSSTRGRPSAPAPTRRRAVPGAAGRARRRGGGRGAAGRPRHRLGRARDCRREARLGTGRRLSTASRRRSRRRRERGRQRRRARARAAQPARAAGAAAPSWSPT